MQRTILGRAAVMIGACWALAACGKKENSVARSDSTGASAAAATASPTPASTDSMRGTATGTPTNTGASATATSNASTMSDADIMAALTASNAAEIEEGKLAERKATDPEVKAFGKTLVADHEAMSKQGAEVAKKLHLVTNPGGKTKDVVGDAKDARKDLEGKTGKDFDKAFVDEQVDGHQKTLDMLNDIAKSDKASADVKQLAQAAIPKVQGHLDKAKQLKDKLSK